MTQIALLTWSAPVVTERFDSVETGKTLHRITLRNADGLTHIQRFSDASALCSHVHRTGLEIVKVEQEPEYRLASIPNPEADDFDAAAVRIVRHRQSVTQGEASVFYGDTLIARFGDQIAFRGGEWQGLADAEWIAAAQRWHRGELRGL